MKNFSRSWKSSKKPRKQRKYRYNAPLHIKYKFLSAHLSKELRDKYKVRSIEVRKNDVVLIMRGDHKGKKLKVIKVDTKHTRVALENLTRKRQDGVAVPIYIHPSNLMIVELDESDKNRFKNILKKQELKTQ